MSHAYFVIYPNNSRQEQIVHTKGSSDCLTIIQLVFINVYAVPRNAHNLYFPKMGE